MIETRAPLAFALVCLVSTGTAAAQGQRGSPPGQGKDKALRGNRTSGAGVLSPSTGSSSSPAASSSAVLYFGSWLDDASVIEPGGAWVGLSTGYWKAEGSRQIDAPVLSAAIGLVRRLHVGGSLPIYHLNDSSGFSASGVGNMHVYGKLGLIDPTGGDGRIGIAITPLLEVAAHDQIGRFSWALPISVEVRGVRARLYGSGGYFSRGSLFGAVGLEVPAGDRVSVFGNFGQSYSTRAGDVDPAAEPTHAQTDIGTGLSIRLGPTSGVHFSVGRTFGGGEIADSGGVWFGGGFSILKLR